VSEVKKSEEGRGGGKMKMECGDLHRNDANYGTPTKSNP
jgi:hypothetical protein